MRYVKISGIIGLISLICALGIALVNSVTSPIIKDNAAKKELETCQSIFPNYDQDKSVILDDYTDSAITKKIHAFDKDGNEIGYLYVVEGKNAYGSISLMVAIADESVVSVEFLTNGQSYASTVADHVNKNYKDDLSAADLAGIDTSCGATYGAELVKKLVKSALNDALGGK